MVPFGGRQCECRCKGLTCPFHQPYLPHVGQPTGVPTRTAIRDPVRTTAVGTIGNGAGFNATIAGSIGITNDPQPQETSADHHDPATGAPRANSSDNPANDTLQTNSSETPASDHQPAYSSGRPANDQADNPAVSDPSEATESDNVSSNVPTDELSADIVD